MEEHLPDVIVIAGDVAESLQTPNHFGTALHIFRKTCPFADLLVVPGNHDLWVNSGADESSLDLWETGLKRRAKEEGAKRTTSKTGWQ